MEVSVADEAVIEVVDEEVRAWKYIILIVEADWTSGRGGFQQSYGPPASVLGKMTRTPFYGIGCC